MKRIDLANLLASSSNIAMFADKIAQMIERLGDHSMTAHTLRHTLGSVAGGMGFSEITIAALLWHGKRWVTQGHRHVEEGLRVAADRVSACMTDLLEGKRATIRDAGVAIAE